jgi:hypothetical protein
MIWQKRTIKWEKGFPIQAKPGHNVFVANRGELVFEYPGSWIVKPSENAICFHDAEPPADDCVLELSILHLDLSVDWSQCPLAEILCAAAGGESGPRDLSAVHEFGRKDLKIVWLESTFTDPVANRLALSRSALALRAEVLPLFTFSFWPEHKLKWEPVWQGLFETLRLAEGQQFKRRN